MHPLHIVQSACILSPKSEAAIWVICKSSLEVFSDTWTIVGGLSSVEIVKGSKLVKYLMLAAMGNLWPRCYKNMQVHGADSLGFLGGGLIKIVRALTI